MLSEIIKRIYPIGTLVAYKKYPVGKPYLGIVVGYSDEDNQIRIQDYEYPEYITSCERQDIKAYYSKEACDKDLKNRDFL